MPTPGRVVWYHPAKDEAIKRSPNSPDTPLAAMVAGVLNDRLVNLSVLDFHGEQHVRRNVILIQPGDTAPHSDAWCEWMPYQIGQAKQAGSS